MRKEKTYDGEGNQDCWVRSIEAIYKLFRQKPNKKVTFEQRHQGDDGERHADIWGRVFQTQGRGETKTLNNIWGEKKKPQW
jgi:hypothetical protein